MDYQDDFDNFMVNGYDNWVGLNNIKFIRIIVLNQHIIFSLDYVKLLIFIL